ncbi:MAG: hypothetical protein RIC16_06770 [Rhodospirillales bacterium]
MTVWKTDRTWTYEHFPPSEAAENFPGVERLVKLWQSKRTVGNPAWSDFSLMDFDGFWGWLVVHDSVPGSPLCFDVRLFGTRIAEICNYDLSGQRICADDRPTSPDYVTITATDLEYYRFLLDEDRIGCGFGPFKRELGDLHTYSAIQLPLSRSGLINDQILVIAQIVD